MNNQAIGHYDSLIDEGNDPVHDPAPLNNMKQSLLTYLFQGAKTA